MFHLYKNINQGGPRHREKLDRSGKGFSILKYS